jgi:hypothetical protein
VIIGILKGRTKSRTRNSSRSAQPSSWLQEDVKYTSEMFVSIELTPGTLTVLKGSREGGVGATQHATGRLQLFLESQACRSSGLAVALMCAKKERSKGQLAPSFDKLGCFVQQ